MVYNYLIEPREPYSINNYVYRMENETANNKKKTIYTSIKRPQSFPIDYNVAFE